MLHPFISARAVRAPHRDVGGLATSVVLHAGVIALAIAATAPTIVRNVRVPSSGVEHVVFTGIRHVEPTNVAAANVARAPKHARRGRGLARAAARATSRLAAQDFAAAIAVADATIDAMMDAVRVDAPTIDLQSVASGGLEFAHDGLAEFSGRVKYVPRPNAGDAYTEDAVEKVVAPYGDNPRPRYPGQLQSRDLEASFVVKFVVDSTGRVRSESLQFPQATHHLFVRSVRAALLRSRFLPAELGGHRVSQLVQQRYSFVMERLGRR
jgi:TonB family protein